MPFCTDCTNNFDFRTTVVACCSCGGHTNGGFNLCAGCALTLHECKDCRAPIDVRLSKVQASALATAGRVRDRARAAAMKKIDHSGAFRDADLLYDAKVQRIIGYMEADQTFEEVVNRLKNPQTPWFG